MKRFLFYILYWYSQFKKSLSYLAELVTSKPITHSIVDSERNEVYYPLVHTNLFLNSDNVNQIMQKYNISKLHVWYIYLGRYYCNVITKPISDNKIFLKKNKKYRFKYLSASYCNNDIDKVISWYGGPDGNFYMNDELKGCDISHWPCKPLINSVIDQKKDDKIEVMDAMANNIEIYDNSCVA